MDQVLINESDRSARPNENVWCSSNWPAGFMRRAGFPWRKRPAWGRADHYALGVQRAESGIPRQYGLTEAMEDIAHARR